MGINPGAAAAGAVSTDLMTILAGRDTRWYKGCLLKLNLLLFVVCLANCGNGFDGSMMNGVSSLTTWKDYFGHPEKKGTLFGVFNAIQTIGSVAGLPFAPIINDRLGRKWSIIIGNLIVILATGIQTASTNVGMFIGSRALVGFGLSFACMGAPILLTECAFPTHRAPITAAFSTGWGFGAILAAWTTYGSFRIPSNWAWRLPSLLQGVASVIQLLFIYWVPESPRWLIDQGREEEARAFLANYHCNGDFNDPLVDFEFAEIKEAIRAEKEAAESSSWKEVFTTLPNLRRMRIYVALAIAGQWSGSGVISYYLTLVLNGIGITAQKDQTLINGMNSIFGWLVGITFAMLVDKLGRRKMIIFSFLGMGFNFMAWTICSAVYTKSSTIFDPACLAANNGDSSGCVALNANKAAGHAVLAFVLLNSLWYNMGIGPLGTMYTLEILPYRIRTKGTFVYQLTTIVALVFNQYVNPIALNALHWKYYLVFVCFIFFEVLYFYFFLIETRGPNGALPLEEISYLFESGAYGFQKHKAPEHRDDIEGHNDSPGTPDEKDAAAVYNENVATLKN